MSEQQAPATESKILREVAEDYIDSLVFSETKASSVKIYLRAIQLATDYFGAQRTVDSITSAHVGRFFNSNHLLKLPNGCPRADITVKQIRRVFRQCMEFALEKGWIAKTPVPKSEMEHARVKKDTPKPIEATAQN